MLIDQPQTNVRHTLHTTHTHKYLPCSHGPNERCYFHLGGTTRPDLLQLQPPCLRGRLRSRSFYHSGFPALASMTKGLGCPLAIGGVEEEQPGQSRNLWLACPSAFPLGLMMVGPCLAMMTGLSEGVFLPSGQIAVGRSGAFFYELRYSGLENKQAANETFYGNWHK